jgi:hypothetical protein
MISRYELFFSIIFVVVIWNFQTESRNVTSTPTRWPIKQLVTSRAVHSGFDQTVEETGYCSNRLNKQYLYWVNSTSRQVLSYKFLARFAGTGYEHP